MSVEDLSPEEMEELQRLGLGAPQPHEKKDVFGFLGKVLKTEDTIKVGNLDGEEIIPVRVLRDASVLSGIIGHDIIKDYFDKRAEVILGSSLSKSGFLIDMAVTTKKESTIGTKARNEGGKKTWFKKKDEA